MGAARTAIRGEVAGDAGLASQIQVSLPAAAGSSRHHPHTLVRHVLSAGSRDGRELMGGRMTLRQEHTADDLDVARLVGLAAEGDGQAWERLVDKYARLIWAVTRDFKLMESDAADVAQVTWMRLLEHINRLDHPNRVGSWLAATARHECLRSLAARKKVMLGQDDDALEGVAAHGPEVDERLLAAENAENVRKALSSLPPRWQQLLEMLMADPPASYTEISEQLGLPVGSIGPTRGRCLAKLRTLLQPIEQPQAPESSAWSRRQSPPPRDRPRTAATPAPVHSQGQVRPQPDLGWAGPAG